MTAPTFEVTVRRSGGVLIVSPADAGTDISASGDIEGDRIRVGLRGRGTFVLRFDGMHVRDVDVRGGFVFVEPGTPFAVRGTVDGWLSVTARLARG